MTKVKSIDDYIGNSVGHFSDITKMDWTKQVVPELNDQACVNCGKCYFTCLDSGYQAIDFDSDTHFPIINEERCTGCGLCVSVCPIDEALEYRPRKLP